MRILQINSHYDQGGAARIVACIHRSLLESGEDAYVAYGRGEKSTEKNVYMFGNNVGVYLSAFFSRFIGINGWFNYTATRRLIRHIKRLNPDIIHLHVLHGYYLNVPMLFSYINKYEIPCVWTFHDCHAFVGNCGYFFECRKWESGCDRCPSIRNYPTSQWFDWTKWMWIQKKDMFTQGGKKIVVTPSEWLTGEAGKSFMGKYKCVTIPNGVDTKNIFYPRERAWCRKKYGFSEKDKLVLGIAVGYRDARKGAKYIIQMARDLVKEAKVILIGWNQENDKLIEDVANIITIPNTRDTDMLAEYYSMADVFVLPSLAENYATTTLEAMACGTPVVGFDVGGITEQLKDNKGVVVEKGNQEAFTSAVRDVLQDKYNLLRGEELAEVIRQENSIEGMTEAYEQVYCELLNKRDKRV